MDNNNYLIKPGFFHNTLPFLALAIALPLSAMANESSGQLEEVVVTAQRKVESLQDVPISVSTLSGNKIAEAGITKIEDLQAYVPNFTQTETALGTNLFIRGIGSGINPGFEQSVGLFKNGVSHGRAQLARAPFLDLERAEVLRGPQNVLYGRNSIAGAVSLISAKPTDTFEGSVGFTYEPRFGDRIGDLVLSGPISEKVSARIAHRSRRLDGFVENLDADDEPNRDERTTRLSLRWEATERLEANFIYENSVFDVSGRQIEILSDEPSLNPALGGANFSQFLLSLNADNAASGASQTPASVLNTELDFQRSSNGDFSDTSTETITLEFAYTADNYTLTSTTALLTYDFSEQCDCDFTSANLFFFDTAEDYEQFSQEIRIDASLGNAVDITGGLYYQRTELDVIDLFRTAEDSIFGNLFDLVLPPAFEELTGADVFPAEGGQIFNGLTVPRAFAQDVELFSAFFQVDWQLSSRARLTLGGRLASEDKDARRQVEFADLEGNLLPFNDTFVPTQSIGIDFFLGQILQVVRHDLEGQRNETQFAPSIQFEYDFGNNSLAYASWARGFKAGGFDVRSNAPPTPTTLNPAFPVTVNPGAFEFEEEETSTIELGLKTRFNDGKAELNVALFYTEFDDLQVSIFDGTLGFNIGNAAAATSQGLEIDGRWALTKNWRLGGSLALLDFEFDDFPNGQCTQLERITTGETLCDFAGLSNQFVADISAVFTASYSTSVTRNLLFDAALDLIHTSDYNPSANVDPAIEQDGFTKVNLRLSLAGINNRWELSLLGKNLTDEEVVTFASDTPLSAQLVGSIGFYGFVEPPRTVALQGVFRF